MKKIFSWAVKIVSSPFVAGDKPEDALRVAAELNKQGVDIIINFLGEDVLTDEQAKENVKIYCQLLHEINTRGLRARISIKPTQLGLPKHIGLKLDKYAYRYNLADLAKVNLYYHIPLEIDMEGPETVNETIASTIYLKECLPELDLRQSVAMNFSDSFKWVFDLTSCKVKIRLCKGAYGGDLIGESGLRKRLLSAFLFLLNSSADPDVATHDMGLIGTICFLKEKYSNCLLSGFQFLLGFRRRTRRKLVEGGERVVVYAPFGTNRLPYAKRRWKYLLKNLPSFLLGD